MEATLAERAAEWLLSEHASRRQFQAFKAPLAPATIVDACDIQDRYVELLRERNGDPIGYKVGLTSAAMQAFCGINHPIAGVVLAKRLHRSGAQVSRSSFGRLGLEFEIAVRIGSDIPAGLTSFTADSIAPHIGGVCAAIELVDDRAADYAGLDVLSLVADNSWNAGIVLSEFTAKWPDLAEVPGRASKDGEPIGGGHGRDILGHPFNSVAWLSGQLASRGSRLKAGQVVMTGSVMKTIFPDRDARYRFELGTIGSVEVELRS